jgi:Multidrug resistance efflux pump
VREAQANLADAEVQVRLIESVTDKRAVRDEDVQRRRLAYKAAQARLAEVEAQLGLLKAGAWAPDIAVAKSEVAQAEAQVKMAETNIDRLTMRAPIAGVILQNKVRLGQFAQCGPLSEPLMILGSVTPLHVRVMWMSTMPGVCAAEHWRRVSSWKRFYKNSPGVCPLRALCDPQEVAQATARSA